QNWQIEFDELIIDTFLTFNNVRVYPKLGDYIGEDSSVVEIYGSVEPVYKLPTNGDFVLLMIYYMDAFDYLYRSQILSYDLNGNFLGIFGTFITSGINNYINCEINSDLEFVHTYVDNLSDNRYLWRRDCRPCTGNSRTDIYQIQSDGTSSLKSSTDNGPGTFYYNGYYFEKQP
ncbi:MAG: hypothetical protein OEW87_13765, partial [Flavobacteriaceae bacterium]|nr:hypothetical protein [Flavobacteriaceae bacterium]